MSWQLQQAKRRLSEVVERARREGPQIVTRHGAEVVRIEEYRRLVSQRPDFKRFLLERPRLDELVIEPSTEPAGEVEL